MTDLTNSELDQAMAAHIPQIASAEEEFAVRFRHVMALRGMATAPASDTSQQDEPQVMGRVHNDRGQGEAWLNSVGRELPDDTPLYAAPARPSPEAHQQVVWVRDKGNGLSHPSNGASTK